MTARFRRVGILGQIRERVLDIPWNRGLRRFEAPWPRDTVKPCPVNRSWISSSSALPPERDVVNVVTP